ncbi:MmgE/PrpD family protein [Caenimonas aquaedulcis]|uniref:MmgE/PrpD family protein n=1 Tax=Caenimonas aquaedulcis TaxID=2793270 RepID=A0A931H8P7_9BURK|nr:MmgE/PrpD family protein [Caenimonas aquaedulcis]MBG9390598.1 MmgE/PrpD family protein [Caenimonas aquaedulcis]
MTAAAQQIARFASEFRPSSLSAAHLEACGRAMADTFAVAIAARGERPVECALRYARGQGSGGPARLWGTALDASVEGAALFNGIAAHALDYDDASSPMCGHPSVVLLPALVALGQARAVTGPQLAAAYVAGFEVACRLGRGLDQTHYDRGWHMTATVGTVASAVACGNLLRLDQSRITHAIGFAVAQAAGTRASFGTDAKSFQAGYAAASGARAALLAEAGLTAAGDALDGKAGFTALYSAGEELADSFASIGHEPLEIDRSGIEVKKYPACYAVHRALDGMFDLRDAHRFTADAVSEIQVETSYGALAPLIKQQPTNATEARFSMQYALAAALVDGEISLQSFSDDAIRRPAIQALMPRITAREQHGTMTPRWATLEVKTAEGQRWSTRVETLRGAPEKPLTHQQLQAKVADCLRWGNSALEAPVLMKRALSLDILQSAFLAA